MNSPLLHPNPIVDGACTRIAGGLESTAAHCEARGIYLELDTHECESDYHDHVNKCSEAQITVFIYSMPITDFKGNLVYIHFYITCSDAFLLLGNKIKHKPDQSSPK